MSWTGRKRSANSRKPAPRSGRKRSASWRRPVVRSGK
jgi:hypothetical protein